MEKGQEREHPAGWRGRTSHPLPVALRVQGGVLRSSDRRRRGRQGEVFIPKAEKRAHAAHDAPRRGIHAPVFAAHAADRFHEGAFYRHVEPKPYGIWVGRLGQCLLFTECF